ncbi:hypothetical protein D3C74_35350 [compost metagenome]
MGQRFFAVWQAQPTEGGSGALPGQDRQEERFQRQGGEDAESQQHHAGGSQYHQVYRDQLSEAEDHHVTAPNQLFSDVGNHCQAVEHSSEQAQLGTRPAKQRSDGPEGQGQQREPEAQSGPHMRIMPVQYRQRVADKAGDDGGCKDQRSVKRRNEAQRLQPEKLGGQHQHNQARQGLDCLCRGR